MLPVYSHLPNKAAKNSGDLRVLVVPYHASQRHQNNIHQSVLVFRWMPQLQILFRAARNQVRLSTKNALATILLRFYFTGLSRKVTFFCWSTFLNTKECTLAIDVFPALRSAFTLHAVQTSHWQSFLSTSHPRCSRHLHPTSSHSSACQCLFVHSAP